MAKPSSWSGSDLPGRDEHAERDGQVEGAGVLAQVGGRQVDDGAAGWAAVAEVGERALDAVDALAHGQFGQPDEDGLRQLAGAASTSTSTGTASMPTRAKVRSLASMATPKW